MTPGRGPRRELRFTFADLVALRAAQELATAKIPSTRIMRALRKLREQLPAELPRAGLRIEASGDRIVVVEGSTRWQPDTGQYLLGFEVAAPQGKVRFAQAVPRRDRDTEGAVSKATDVALPARNRADAAAWFAEGERLEGIDSGAACAAYRRAIEADAQQPAAYVNLGRVLHDRGDLQGAHAVYRQAAKFSANDATLHFNLGVLLEDLGRAGDAAQAYLEAVRIDPSMADAHYNLALMHAAAGRKREALRHFNAYRQLQRRGN